MNGTQIDVGFKASHAAKTDEFTAPSRAEYNRLHGRRAAAPTKGGPRQKAYDALLKPGKATD